MGLHVLVPVDGSEQSEKALDYALTELPEPRITLVHVMNRVNMFGYVEEGHFDYEGLRDEEERHEERARRMLREYREKAEEQGIDARTVLETGAPAKRILRTAEKHGVDHIVMGSRGRSGVGRVLFGSVAETVTRRAGVPVTIVR